MFMIKQLIHHGNSRAIVIDKALLEAAHLDPDSALFQIVVNPNGGITIQSVEAVNTKLHKKAFREVLKENNGLMKRLAQR